MEGEELGLLGGEGSDSGGVAEEEISGGDGGEETFIEGEAEAQEGEGRQQEEGGAEGEEGERRPGDAKAFPVELRKAFRELSAANPDFQKRFPGAERKITAALFKAGEADKMGGLQNLRAASELVESHGGAEGIHEMAEEVEASRMMEEGFKQGDPILVDTWAKEYPDGFKSLVGPAIERLEGMDLAAHDRAISWPLYKTLDRCGVIGTLGELKAAIAGANAEETQKHFNALEHFILELRNFATRAKAPDPLAADREQLNKERQEILTDREKNFRSAIENEVNGHIMGYTNRLLRQALAGRKLRVDTANRIREQINKDLVSAVRQIPNYAERFKAIRATGDHAHSVQYVVSAARQKLPLIVKRVLRDFNLGGGSTSQGAGLRRAVATGDGRGGGNTRTVAGRPQTGDVDFTRTDKANWIASAGRHGEAWLKNGKKAQW